MFIFLRLLQSTILPGIMHDARNCEKGEIGVRDVGPSRRSGWGSASSRVLSASRGARVAAVARPPLLTARTPVWVGGVSWVGCRGWAVVGGLRWDGNGSANRCSKGASGRSGQVQAEAITDLRPSGGAPRDRPTELTHVSSTQLQLG